MPMGTALAGLSITAIRYAATLVVAALAKLAKPHMGEWTLISPKKPKKDSAGRRLHEMRVEWVPGHMLRRVIGEFGATIRNMEEETGAKFDIEEDPPAVCIYAHTEASLSK